MSAVHDLIARRVAARLPAGAVVNLGIGIPTRVADHIDPAHGIVVQSENGMLGVGPAPTPGKEDPTLVNAGKLPVTESIGAAYFSSAQSFALIRGGHVDVSVLGTLQVDERGRIANWSVPGRPILGVGGAMDLLAGARSVIVATTHLTKDGQPKIVPACTLPLTGDRPVSLVVTEHATFAVDGDGLTLTEVAPGSTVDWVRDHTAAAFREDVAARPEGAAR
jgi:3-oxoacid CoA-transferase B subunit